MFLLRVLLLLASAAIVSCANAQVSAPATITGTVTDSDAALLPSAELTLTPGAGVGIRKTSTDAGGHFTFRALPPGAYTLTTLAPGFLVNRTPITLSPGQFLDLAAIVLTVADTQDISVQPTRAEMAEADVKLEESQRVLWVLPNFFVTYNWKAPPLAGKQKFELAWKSIVDPATIAGDGAFAALQQATNSFPGYHQGAEGYFKRFGAVQADATVGNLLGGALFPILFHQDPRYFYKGTGGVWRRTLYALSTAVICRGDNGKWQPNYSGVLGDIATGAVSNLYYPASDRNGASLTIANGLLNAAGDGVGNLIQELVVRHFTPNLPPPRP